MDFLEKWLVRFMGSRSRPEGIEISSNVDTAKEYLARSVADLKALEANLDTLAFRRSVALLNESDCVWVTASRRSFPVAAYLDYALQHTEKRVITVNAVECTRMGQINSVRGGDLMVAISSAPYANETLNVARSAIKRGARLIAITDSALSPLAQLATETLVIQETTAHGFRTLSCTMGLVQSLLISLEHSRQEKRPH